jgi:hypothetical protein
VAGSLGRAHGIGAGVTGGPQVSNAEHISELSGPFANAGGQLGGSYTGAWGVSF